MHLLIPYIILLDHPDPDFREFTYGDSGRRARKLKRDVKKGDYIFFHTTIHGKKYITAYYIVDRVIDAFIASKDRAIAAKYRNPHIVEYLEGRGSKNNDDNVVVFGDPITSNILQKPLPFNRKLIEKLSLNIRFSPNKSETQVIGSATRAWRELTDGDVEILLDAIIEEQKSLRRLRLLSSEEVSETLERDIGQYIAHNPTLLGEGLKLLKQEEPTREGRLDILLGDGQGDLLVVEIKYGRIGRDALRQVKTYVRDMQEKLGKKVTGAIVCAGVMPAYEDELKRQKDIKVFIYGWELKLEKWKDLY